MKTKIVMLCFSLSAVFARKSFGPIEQEWGYVTVRPGAHMFWWLYQTIARVTDYTERPLVIWLQGGPGIPSTGFGNFIEVGPMDINFEKRDHTWLNNYNVLFVDNPVGTGYSYVDSNFYLATTNQQIAEDFVQLLKGFYEAVPALKNSPLYIFSVSYGGKMAVEIALMVDKAIKSGFLEIELAGIGLGDAWISPVDIVLTWAPYLFHLGAVDLHGYEKVQEMAEATKAAFGRGDYAHATALMRRTLSVISSVTGNIDVYNVLTKIPTVSQARRIKRPFNLKSLKSLMNNQVRKALRLNVPWSRKSDAVYDALLEDLMKPVTNIVELLLNTTNIKIAVFNGQLDLIVDTPGTIKWVDELKFYGSDLWKTADRKLIRVNDVVEGYYKKVGNLAMYWVNRAGHSVTLDNPGAMNYILRDTADY